MWAAEARQRFAADSSGAAILEFTIVAWLFFVTVFGVVEFGYYFWQMGAASKGGQVALRYAVVSNPVTPDWASLTPGSGKVITCRGQAAGAAATCSPGLADDTAMDCIIKKVQAFAPFVEPQNVVVDYRANAIGESGVLAPTIQLRLENLQFTTMFLGFLGDMTMPQLNYTMTAEDMNSAPPVVEDEIPEQQCE